MRPLAIQYRKNNDGYLMLGANFPTFDELVEEIGGVGATIKVASVFIPITSRGIPMVVSSREGFPRGYMVTPETGEGSKHEFEHFKHNVEQGVKDVKDRFGISFSIKFEEVK